MQEQVNEANTTPPAERIRSIDALRGFDMLCIIGGMGFVGAILPFCGSTIENIFRPQIEHAAWEGFTFCDLIFPLFIFLVGITTVLSLGKIISREGKKAAYVRLLRRSALLFLLGVFYYGGFSHHWPNIRLLGVLQRIALCYLF
ncbi:MAG: DUF5009 domain-containing protein, partial [Thermoguttaceae bacterium]